MLSKEKVEIKSSMGAHDKIERSMWEEEDYINHKRWFQNGMRKKVSYNYGSILHIPNIHPYDEYIISRSSIDNKEEIQKNIYGYEYLYLVMIPSNLGSI